MKSSKSTGDFLTKEQLKAYLSGDLDAQGKAGMQKLLNDPAQFVDEMLEGIRGAKPVDKFPQHQHLVPMLSLDNAFGEQPASQLLRQPQ